RIGFDPADVYDACGPETARVIDDARQVLAGLGARLVDVAMPEKTRAMYEAWTGLCAAEAAVAHERWYPARKAEYGRVLAGLLDKGRALAGTELARILQDRLVFAGQLRRLFAE